MCALTGVKLYKNNTYETGRYINMARFVDFLDLNNVMFLSKKSSLINHPLIESRYFNNDLGF